LNIERVDISGNPNIGVFVFANNKVALMPPRTPQRTKKVIEATLEVDAVEVTVAGMRAIGVLVAGNDRAILLPYIASDEEVDKIKESVGRGIAVRVVESKKTALGNLIVANGKAAIASAELEESALAQVESALGVRVYARKYAGLPTVGSMLVVNNSVGLASPYMSDEEISEVSSLLGVRAAPATVNEGVRFVRSGAVANDKGIVLGSATTGPEVFNIQSIVG